MDIVQRLMAWGTRQSGGRTSTRVTAVLAAVYGLDSADKGAVGAMATQLQHGLGIGKTELGLLLTVSSLAGVIGTIPFGWLVDRTSRTRVLSIAVLLWGLAMLACATATSYSYLLLARLGLGVVVAAGVPAVASLTGDYFQPHLRGRMYGYILAGEFVGTGFGFTVAGELALLSWRAGFLVLALTAPLVAWLVYRLPEPARGGADWFRPEGALPSKPSEGASPYDRDAAGVAENPGNKIRDLIRATGIRPRDHLVFDENPGRKSLSWATWYVLHIPTNLILIVASALGYYFFAGARTFGVEFMQGWFDLSHSGAIAVAVTFGAGALVGVLAGGRFADHLLARRYLSARVLVAVVAYLAAALFLIPALLSHALVLAVPSLALAALFFGAANPPADAARLDIMHPYLWGRAEAIRTVLRLVAEAIGPLLFGFIAEHVFGGGPAALDHTLLVMLIPLFVSASIGLVAFRTYPRDVATADAYTRRTEEQNTAGTI
jgi:predicted MFS family arabinose efflux permease